MQRFRLFLAVSLSIALLGCASSNAPHYAAPAGDAAGLATLETDGVSMDGVDGAHLADRHHVQLAPGTHTIHFTYSAHNPLGTYTAINQASMTYAFTAAKTYVIKKENKLFTFKAAKLMLVDKQSGRELTGLGGESVFKVN